MKTMPILRFILFPVLFLTPFSILHAEEPPSKAKVEINGKAVLPSNGTVAGVWFFHDADRKTDGAQILLTGFAEPTPKYRIVVVLNPGDSIRITPGDETLPPLEFQAEQERKVFKTVTEYPLDPIRRPWSLGPTECSPEFHDEIQAALIEHDWRLQDGIDTPQQPRSYLQAIRKMTPQIRNLLQNLKEADVSLGDLPERFEKLAKNTSFSEEQWLALHQLRREAMLKNPLFDTGPLVFAKHVPSVMSHQLTQTYGYVARPGGGLFVLENPGRSMKLKPISAAASMPMGNFVHPEVSFDGKKIYFAFCEVSESPKYWRDPDAMERWYHLYEMNADGTGLRQLTEGKFNDFNPTPLPDGKLMFISTRRGGYHRCGGGPCYVYTLATMDLVDSRNQKPSTDHSSLPTVLSFHETQEWDPSVLDDGRVIYTRWDYVDRDAVFYQQLWTVRQDGTNARIFYGNNTFVPCGIWEARGIPGSHKVVAVAAPHHGMTAGSVIMLDTSIDVDGPDPITRLTPDARFPEGEVVLAAGTAMPEPSDFDTPPPFYWDAVNRPDRPAYRETNVPEQEARWKAHCYKSPWPLSEQYFIASYSYDWLRGELGPNIPNMFGIYFMDAFGNKELIYRDPNISSVWAKPLKARPTPPVFTAGIKDALGPQASSLSECRLEACEPRLTGTFYMQNVYESWPKLPNSPEDRITALRLVQVLPKTTPNANDPMVGAAFASPGKQVLGTVPVEEDGSAFFEVPAKIPVHFQALDSKGRSVQTMRSLVYLQPGENMSCVGCHEHRTQTFAPNHHAIALKKKPSKITPGPDGSKPLSYPILVQPVLDTHCVSCHAESSASSNAEQNGGVILTGKPEGHYTQSYNALISRVSYTAWSMPNGNYEPLTEPNRFGARASALVKLLENGHYDVKLSAEDWDRLNTWIDANALFYGTFNREDQARQQQGERIAGPDLE